MTLTFLILAKFKPRKMCNKNSRSFLINILITHSIYFVFNKNDAEINTSKVTESSYTQLMDYYYGETVGS